MTQALSATPAFFATANYSCMTAPGSVASAFPRRSRPFSSSSCCSCRLGELCHRATVTRPHGIRPVRRDRGARAQIEQRQALIEAALERPEGRSGAGRRGRQRPARCPAARSARVEQQQLQQAALVADALDVRYQVTAAELKKLGISPARVGGPAASADRSKAPATRPSRRCSTAGRSSTSCRTA